MICPRGHSFDIARRGYINLLPLRDRRSRRPGDSAEAIEARRRLVARGLAAPLASAVVGLLPIASDDAVLDAGCGEGHHLAAIAERFGCEAHGVDISVVAIEAAAKRYPRIQWIVANADRLVPYPAASFRAVTSITARMNAVEFRRVLRDDGILLVVVPAPDDLIELREQILGTGIRRDRVERTITTFAPLFTLERHRRLHHVAHLDSAAVADVMTSSYRALRTREHGRLISIGDTDVTFAYDLLLFRPS